MNFSKHFMTKTQCIHTYIHTYVRTYIHTYMHTYTHTSPPPPPPSSQVKRDGFHSPKLGPFLAGWPFASSLSVPTKMQWWWRYRVRPTTQGSVASGVKREMNWQLASCSSEHTSYRTLYHTQEKNILYMCCDSSSVSGLYRSVIYGCIPY